MKTLFLTLLLAGAAQASEYRLPESFADVQRSLNKAGALSAVRLRQLHETPSASIGLMMLLPYADEVSEIEARRDPARAARFKILYWRQCGQILRKELAQAQKEALGIASLDPAADGDWKKVGGRDRALRELFFRQQDLRKLQQLADAILEDAREDSTVEDPRSAAFYSRKERLFGTLEGWAYYR